MPNNPVLFVNGLKPCSRCGELKTPEEFYRNNSLKSGRDSQCKACQCPQRASSQVEPEPTSRVCRTCGHEKPIDCFGLENHGTYSTRRTDCRECRRAMKRAWAKANREHIREYKRTHREGENGWRRRSYAANPKTRDAVLRYNRRMRLKCSEDDIKKLESAWTGRCPICDTADPKHSVPSKNWHVDHDHSTGKLRAILCWRCNLMLGQASDNPEILRKGAEYLEKHKENCDAQTA